MYVLSGSRQFFEFLACTLPICCEHTRASTNQSSAATKAANSRSHDIQQLILIWNNNQLPFCSVLMLLVLILLSVITCAVLALVRTLCTVIDY
jgi:hypothetical protein